MSKLEDEPEAEHYQNELIWKNVERESLFSEVKTLTESLQVKKALWLFPIGSN